MTTSGVTTGLLTVGDLVTDAFRKIQVLAAGETLGNSDADLGIRQLNYMLKDWQNDGVNLWRQDVRDLAYEADALEADFPGVEDILSLAYNTTYERQLTRWELADYASLPNKAQSGAPTIYCATNELDGVRLRLWPVPTEDITLKAVVSRTIEDVTSATQTIDVPQKYTRMVMLNLAAALAPDYGRADDPNTVLVIREAARLYQIARAADRPTSYFLLPARGRYGYQY